MYRAANSNKIDIEAKANEALVRGCNFLVLDLKCGSTIGLISTPINADTKQPVFKQDDGE